MPFLFSAESISSRRGTRKMLFRNRENGDKSSKYIVPMRMIGLQLWIGAIIASGRRYARRGAGKQTSIGAGGLSVVPVPQKSHFHTFRMMQKCGFLQT
jgi:hypothetical protein